MKICPECQKEYTDDSNFCPKCGSPLTEVAAPQEAPKTTTYTGLVNIPSSSSSQNPRIIGIPIPPPSFIPKSPKGPDVIVIKPEDAPVKSFESSEMQEAIDLLLNAHFPEAQGHLEREADNGDARAHYYLGLMYQYGLGLSDNKEEAEVQWQQGAAKQDELCKLRSLKGKELQGFFDKHKAELLRVAYKGHPFLSYELGALGIHFTDFGLDEQDALDLLVQSSKKGNFLADYELYLVFENKGDERTSQNYLQKATDKNYHQAMLALAKLYKAINIDQYLEWLKNSSEFGNREAADLLAQYYIGQVDDSINPEEGFNLLKKAVANGSPEVAYKLATCYKDGRGTEPDSREAYMWCKFAAEKEYKPAIKEMYKYAEAYGQIDASELCHWIRLAANLGDNKAQYIYGQHLESGIGCKRNSDAATMMYMASSKGGHYPASVQLFRIFRERMDYETALVYGNKAIEQGCEKLYILVGELYLQFQGRKAQDYQKAFSYFEKAAQANDPKGYYNLGICCWKGIGAPKDDDKAKHYMETAQKLGSPQAASVLKQIIRSTINPLAKQQRARWEKTADAWLKKCNNDKKLAMQRFLKNIPTVPNWQFEPVKRSNSIFGVFGRANLVSDELNKAMEGYGHTYQVDTGDVVAVYGGGILSNTYKKGIIITLESFISSTGVEVALKNIADMKIEEKTIELLLENDETKKCSYAVFLQNPNEIKETLMILSTIAKR